jgi:hypothetical protein
MDWAKTTTHAPNDESEALTAPFTAPGRSVFDWWIELVSPNLYS